MRTVDPSAGKIGKRGEVFLSGQNLRLEAPHLAGRGRPPLDGMTANNPTHGGITAETVGIVHVVVATKTAKNGGAELPDKTVATVLPTTGVCEYVPGNLGPAISVSPTASSSSRYDNNPASVVTLEPWNSSFKRRSKYSLRTPSFDSPIG